MTLLAWDITEKQQNRLGNTNPQVYRTVFITEDVARDLSAKYRSKGALEDALTTPPAWMADLTGKQRIWTIATMNKGETPLLVTGDADRNKFHVMPSGG